MNTPRLLAGATALVVCLLTGVTTPTFAATITIVNSDDPGVGFNDPTPAALVAGNPGTTLGQQRLLAFQAAANAWGSKLRSSVPIEIEATMADLDCDATSATLGTAGPRGFVRDSPGLPEASLWYPLALANAFEGFDLADDSAEVVAGFNRNLDDDPACLGGTSWWYGIGTPAPSGMIPFVETVTHEIAHGLGFTTFVDTTTGARRDGFDDVYMRNLEDHSSGRSWSSMTNNERRDSARDSDLHWTGGQVVGASGVLIDGAHLSGHLEMHAPAVFSRGSSVTHWAEDVTPDEIMEAFLRSPSQDLVTSQLLEDIGWQLLGPTEPCVSDDDTLCLISDRFHIEVDYLTATGANGPGRPVAFTDNSGLIWFFNADNFEMLIKVLDGCSINNNYWVFFAATTDVQFEVRVTDTQTGDQNKYLNPLGQPANAITDTAAFANCPSTVTTPSAPSSRFTSLFGSDSPTESMEDQIAATIEAQMQQELTRARTSRLRPAVAPPKATASGGDPTPGRVAGATSRSAVRTLGQPRLFHPAKNAAANARISSAGLLGPTGTTYEPEPLLGTDLDNDGFVDLFTVQGPDGTNVVVFDSARENLKAFDPALGLATQPRAQESIETIDEGKVKITLTMDTSDGETLFPEGFTAGTGGPALDTGALVIGLFDGTDPLDFSNLGVTAATFDLFDGLTAVDSFVIDEGDLDDFFGSPDPWDGILGVVFPGIVGAEVDRVVTTLEVQLEDNTVDPFQCVEDDDTLCLGAGGRFQVRLNWETSIPTSGPGKKVKIPSSTSSGLYYFFDDKNLEMLIKVLDGCSVNNRHWVFFAATTDVGFTLEVIDSLEGLSKTYLNPLGQAADAITDTAAFATCP